MDIIKDYDLVVDGSDNFDTRYLLNDALPRRQGIIGSIFSSKAWRASSPPTKSVLPLPVPDTAPGLVPS